MTWEMFYDLIRSGVVGRAILATAVTVVACYLVLNNQTVPEWFVAALGTILGYFFGSGTLSDAKVVTEMHNGKGG